MNKIISVFILLFWYGKSFSQTASIKKDSAVVYKIDPICKMKVKPNSKNTIVHNHQSISFCGELCKKKFLSK